MCGRACGFLHAATRGEKTPDGPCDGDKGKGKRAVKSLWCGGPLEHGSDWVLAQGFLIGHLLLVTTV